MVFINRGPFEMLANIATDFIENLKYFQKLGEETPRFQIEFATELLKEWEVH